MFGHGFTEKVESEFRSWLGTSRSDGRKRLLPEYRGALLDLLF